MRGKKPKERKNYILRTENGTLVEVTRKAVLQKLLYRRKDSRRRWQYAVNA